MTRSPILALAALLLLLPLGCLSRSAPEKRQHVLEAERPLPDVESAPSSDAGPRRGVCAIDRIRVSPLFERKGFVYRTGDTTYESDFYNEFFAPPGVQIRQETGRWLGRSDVFEAVTDAHNTGRVDWLLEGRVNEIYVDVRDQPRSVLEIEFVLIDARSPSLDERFRKVYRREREAERRSGEFALALNASLGEILTELEGDLEASLSR
jgi:cholesterol transport system auxiliary component